MSAALGDLETQLFAYVQLRRRQVLSGPEVAGALGLSPTQARSLLGRLARRRLVARVRRDLYLLPLRIPPGGRWNPSEFLALATLMADRAADYQICGPAAFHRYGWDAQVPQRLDVYNTAASGIRQIGAATFGLIQVAPQRLGDTEVVPTPDGVDAVYSSRARSLVDALYDWSRFGSLPRAYDWIRADLKRDPRMAAKITTAAVAFGNTGTMRRLGKLFELAGVSERLLRKLEAQLARTTALIPWCPTRAKRGTVDRRWGVLFNG